MPSPHHLITPLVLLVASACAHSQQPVKSQRDSVGHGESPSLAQDLSPPGQRATEGQPLTSRAALVDLRLLGVPGVRYLGLPKEYCEADTAQLQSGPPPLR